MPTSTRACAVSLATTLALAMASPAVAATIEHYVLTAEGTIYAAGAAGVGVGDAVVITVRVEADSPDLVADPGQGWYDATSLDIQIEGSPYAYFDLATPGVFGLSFVVNSDSLSQDDLIAQATASFANTTLTLLTVDNNVFTSDEIPASLSMSDFSAGDIEWVAGADFWYSDVSTLTYTAVLTPEPSTALLLASGLTLLAASGRRRSQAR